MDKFVFKIKKIVFKKFVFKIKKRINIQYAINA